MKNLIIATLILAAGFLASCSAETPEAVSKPAEFDKWIELQIALRSKPYQPGDIYNSGDFKIIRSVVMPVASKSGPGHSTCLSEGTMIEIKWDHSSPLPRGERGILFAGFSWTIRNALVENGCRRTFGWYSLPNKAFRAEFDSLVSPVSLGHKREEIEKAPVLVIRARLIDVRPKVPDIQLAG